jgi:hypothetical protein
MVDTMPDPVPQSPPLLPVRVVTLERWQKAVTKAIVALVADGRRVPDPVLTALYEAQDELIEMLEDGE